MSEDQNSEQNSVVNAPETSQEAVDERQGASHLPGDEPVFDVLVAGGGMAGVLAACRIFAMDPDAQILVVEKELGLGGRARSTAAGKLFYSYGLNAVSQELFDFANQSVKAIDPEIEDLESVITDRYEKIGVLQGGKVRSVPIEMWFSPKGAKTLGGLAAQRNWPEFEELINKEESADKMFSQVWKKNRKTPVAVVMEHFGAAFGIPDVWSSSVRAIRERGRYYARPLRCGAWSDFFQALSENEAFNQRVTFAKDAMILDSDLSNGVWRLNTSDGDFYGKKLVVAQPPWQATPWLAKEPTPTEVSSAASKTKPNSVVVLSEKLTHTGDQVADLPDILLVPSERVQVFNNNEGEICFQATIDFELSLQAPDVLKAVRRLKRARAKLLQLYPGLVTEGNHIALHPYAWPVSTTSKDARYFQKLGKSSVQSEQIVFCGDCYGGSFDGDKNLIESVIKATQTITGGAVAEADDDLVADDGDDVELDLS